MRDISGISVIVCCYNSADRIATTLRALARQKVDVPHEIVLIDNGSTDNTRSIVLREWAEHRIHFPMQIIDQPLPGLYYARRKGIEAASYSYLLFCDDDNWLSFNYISTAVRLLDAYPNAAACGGLGFPVFEQTKPGWFADYAEAYATGPQNVHSKAGELLSLFGAGLVVRRKVILELWSQGFQPFLVGRTGTSLSSGEDTELTNALVLAGHQLMYSSDMVFHHFMPASRMDKSYLEKLFQAFGNEAPIRNVYLAYLQPGFPYGMARVWIIHLAMACLRLTKYLIGPPKPRSRRVYFIWSVAYVKSLWKLRRRHPDLIRQIKVLKGWQKQESVKQITVLPMAVPSEKFPT